MRSLIECARKVYYDDAVFYVPEDVYEPAEDTFLIADNIDVNLGDRVLDMGTGCGILAIISAFNGGEVVAVDINTNAVKCAKVNSVINGVSDRISLICGDLFNPIRQSELFDLILFNAPYLPCKSEEHLGKVSLAWCGGENGRAIIDLFIDSAPAYLRRNGRILLVQSSLSNIEETERKMRDRGFDVEILSERRFLFETIALIKAIKVRF